MTTVAAAVEGRTSAGGSRLPKKRHSRSAAAIPMAEMATSSGERIRRGSAVRKRARNAISTVSQIGSQAEAAAELHPSRLFHHGHLLLQVVNLHFQLLDEGGLLGDGLLGAVQQLDALRELGA